MIAWRRYALCVLVCWLAWCPLEIADAAATLKQIEVGGVLRTPPVLQEGEGFATPPIGGLIAYSMKAARDRLEAVESRDDWRRRDPELFTLGGITRPEGVVVDRTSGDVILIGHAEEGDAPLTLDDFVAALRARLIAGKWPVVSIDPVPGKPMREGDPQTVRFEGGIDNTQLGADLLDADHRLKRMALGLLPTGVPGGMVSAFQRRLTRARARAPGLLSGIASRLWFEPVQDRVIIRDNVVQLGPMSVSVFTEVLPPEVVGKNVDATSYHDEDCEAFARDISNRFDALARAHPTIARVKGVNGIVAVVAGLEQVDNRPSLDYWLHQYEIREVRTATAVKALRHAEEISESYYRGHVWSLTGGVKLQALAFALKQGDISALSEAVLSVRPAPTAVSWRLLIGEWVIPLSPGALPAAALGPLFGQAAFLEKQHRWDDEIAILNNIVQIIQSDDTANGYHAEALYRRGDAYNGKREYDRAIQDYDEAIRYTPNFAAAYRNRGVVYTLKHQYDRSVEDFDEAIRLNPNLFYVFVGRGTANALRSEYDRAIRDFDEALRLYPNDATAFGNRGAAYAKKGQYDRAITDYDQAIRLDPGTPLFTIIVAMLFAL